ncbi:MAG: hypothetical protein RLP09_09715 [Sandaracinaceae bacterium]
MNPTLKAAGLRYGRRLNDPDFEQRMSDDCARASIQRTGEHPELRAQRAAEEKRARRHAAGKGWPYDGGRV